MAPSLDALVSQALALPPEQRFELAHRLWASIEGPLYDDADAIAEVELREAEVRSGAVTPLPFDQAMKEIRDAIR